MAREEGNPDVVRQSRTLLSKGHNPPAFMPQEVPTFEVGVAGMGGPGKANPRTAGSWPWTAGSFTIGSNRVFQLTELELQTSSPNVHFLMRHSHSGSNATVPGGTIRSWHLREAGRLYRHGHVLAPLMSVRGPGTITVFGVGGRKDAVGSVPFAALPTGGSQMFSAVVRGYIL